MLASCAARAQARPGLIRQRGMSHGRPHHAQASHCSRRDARHGAARRRGRRPRRVVGEGLLPRKRTRRSRRSSPPSSRRPASRSSSSNPHRMTIVPVRPQAALEAGQPPDFLFGTELSSGSAAPSGPTRTGSSTSRDAWPGPGPVRSRRDRRVHLAQRPDGRRGLYALPMGRLPTTSTSGTAFWSRPASPSPTFPKEWDAFWSFWCDRVQPAVREGTGRDDIWARRACRCRVAAPDTDRSSSPSSSSPTTRPGWRPSTAGQVDDPGRAGQG